MGGGAVHINVYLPYRHFQMIPNSWMTPPNILACTFYLLWIITNLLIAYFLNKVDSYLEVCALPFTMKHSDLLLILTGISLRNVLKRHSLWFDFDINSILLERKRSCPVLGWIAQLSSQGIYIASLQNRKLAIPRDLEKTDSSVGQNKQRPYSLLKQGGIHGW